MSLPGPGGQGDNQQAWWLRYGARGVGSAGGAIAIGLGIFNCITLTAACIVAGIWQMIAGFIVVSVEAPCCCMFIDFVDRYSRWAENVPFIKKAAFYILISLPPVFICFGLSTFFGSGLIFVCGALYGIMAVGKKSSRQNMMENASVPTSVFSMKTTLVNAEAPPAT